MKNLRFNKTQEKNLLKLFADPWFDLKKIQFNNMNIDSKKEKQSNKIKIDNIKIDRVLVIQPKQLSSRVEN